MVVILFTNGCWVELNCKEPQKTFEQLAKYRACWWPPVVRIDNTIIDTGKIVYMRLKSQ